MKSVVTVRYQRRARRAGAAPFRRWFLQRSDSSITWDKRRTQLQDTAKREVHEREEPFAGVKSSYLDAA